MSFKYASMLIGAVAFAGLASQTALAQGRDRGHDHWEQLDCQKVGFLVDRDVIRVGRREGTFKAIRLEGRGERVIDRIEMTYRAKPNFMGSAKVCVEGLS